MIEIVFIIVFILNQCNSFCPSSDCVYNRNSQTQCNRIDCDDTSAWRQKYDFIIVGGGTSGCVLANRLSENPKWNVLLLEAGVRENVLTDIPLMAEMLRLTNYVWNFQTEEQKVVCQGLNNKRCSFIAGKALGGTSVVDHMIYTRGSPEDYNEWKIPGWSFKDVEPYFLKLENYKIKEAIKAGTRGTKGPVLIESPRHKTEFAVPFLRAGKELGYDILKPGDNATIGISIIDMVAKNGKRFSSAEAYLKPIEHRRNLHVSLLSLVERVIIDPDTRTAVGVEFRTKYGSNVVNASKEVLISAGAFASPKILMLSGIGPKSQLENANVPVILDLPVGEFLIDHIVYPLMYTAENSSAVTPVNFFNPMIFLDYFANNKGPLVTTGSETALYMKLDDSVPGDAPDTELLNVPITFSGQALSLFKITSGLNDDSTTAVLKNLENKVGIVVSSILLKPKSSGYVKLVSRDPLRHLEIDPGYYSNSEDVDLMIKNIRKGIQLMEQPALKDFKFQLNKEKLPNCKHLEFGSDEYWACAVKQWTVPGLHFIGTCKMGRESDPTAVLDPKLRVKGIRNLRVVDTSAAPNLARGHTISFAYVFGEKASDMIQTAWT